jgi:hypothetical protein
MAVFLSAFYFHFGPAERLVLPFVLSPALVVTVANGHPVWDFSGSTRKEPVVE